MLECRANQFLLQRVILTVTAKHVIIFHLVSDAEVCLLKTFIFL